MPPALWRPSSQWRDRDPEGYAARTGSVGGDWACLTRIGAMIVQNAFQTSDEEKYPMENEHLKAIFAGLSLLLETHARSFSDLGWRLALEDDLNNQRR